MYKNKKRLINACNRYLKDLDCLSYWMPSESATRSGSYFENTKFGTDDDATVDNLFRLLKNAMEIKLKTDFDLEIS